MKVLFACVLEKNEYEKKLYSELVKNNYSGTVLPTTSIKHALLGSNIEPIPVFAGLRHLVDEKEDINSTILMLVDLDELDKIKAIVKTATNNFEKHCGCMFAVPLIMLEGAED